MGTFMRKFVSSLLDDQDRCPETSDDSNILYSIVIRGNSDHFCKADVIIPLRSPKVDELVYRHAKSPLQTFIANNGNESFTVTVERLKALDVPLDRVYLEKKLLCFAFCRKEMVESSLRIVNESDQNYGRSTILQSKIVSITHDTSQELTEPVDVYRGHTVLNHIVKLLNFSGAEVQAVHCSDDKNKMETKTDSMISTSDKSENEIKTTDSPISASCSEKVNSVCAQDPIRLNVRCSGKRRGFSSSEMGNNLKYQHLTDTRTGKAWRVPTEDLMKILFSELRTAMELKYGKVSSEEATKFLEEQSLQCMTLFLLSKNYRDDLKVEVDGSIQNTKEWAFVLYNYARLKMIFKSFESQVCEGSLPPLPRCVDIDFSLLKEEEEWSLVWEYIIRWPEIVEEFAQAVSEDHNKIKTCIIPKFLHGLSHRFSVYYRRFRVLASGKFPHLMPLMHCRLYLVKTLLIIMDICFALIGVVSPPDCM